jgi:hypothetical protein
LVVVFGLGCLHNAVISRRYHNIAIRQQGSLGFGHGREADVVGRNLKVFIYVGRAQPRFKGFAKSTNHSVVTQRRNAVKSKKPNLIRIVF